MMHQAGVDKAKASEANATEIGVARDLGPGAQAGESGGADVVGARTGAGRAGTGRAGTGKAETGTAGASGGGVSGGLLEDGLVGESGPLWGQAWDQAWGLRDDKQQRPQALPLVILGVGAWGQALTRLAWQAGTPLAALWERALTPQLQAWYEKVFVSQDLEGRENQNLGAREKGGDFGQLTRRPPVLTADLSDALSQGARACQGKVHLVLVVATQAAARVLGQIRQAGVSVGSCTLACKGIDQVSGQLVCQLAQEILGPDCGVAALGGPNLAQEISAGAPAALTLACGDRALGRHLVACWVSSQCRVQPSDDVVGVQLLGALKNVMAIGYGLLEQKGVGDNGLAAFLTRASGEMAKCVQALGGQIQTMLTYAGMGDLILTCHSPQGRNSSYGRQFPAPAQGLVEGLATLKALHEHGWLCRVKTPLMWALQQVLTGRASVDFWVRWVSQGGLEV